MSIFLAFHLWCCANESLQAYLALQLRTSELFTMQLNTGWQMNEAYAKIIIVGIKQRITSAWEMSASHGKCSVLLFPINNDWSSPWTIEIHHQIWTWTAAIIWCTWWTACYRRYEQVKLLIQETEQISISKTKSCPNSQNLISKIWIEKLI